MGRNFRRGDAGQMYLMPPDAREWLPPRHLAWELLAVTAEMDLAAFTSWYRADGQGRPAYDPAMMVALAGYCYCKGIRSSRAIELATFDDVGARVICGNLHPDHSTIARFIARHEEPVKGLLVQSIAACAREGLVSVDVVAGDGTKVKANASMAANVTAGQLDLQIGELEALIAGEVGAWVSQVAAADEAEQGAGGGPRGPGAPPARAAQTLARRQRARARLEAEAAAGDQEAEAARAGKIRKLEARAARRRERAARLEAEAAARAAGYQRRAAAKAAAGSARRPDGRVPAAPGDHRDVRAARRAADNAGQALAQAIAARAAPPPPGKVNTTDPASKVMPGKHGGFLQACNPQIVACATQVILSVAAHDSPADVRALHPALARTRANLDAAGITGPIRAALWDAGYASDDNFTAPCEAELYVAVTREARQTGRLRDGRQPATMKPSWQQMAARLDTPRGKALYKQRAAIIEPVFAQLFARLGRHLNYRDGKADLELHLWAASHNLLKAIRARRRTAAAAAAS
jgi:transposase